MISRIRGTLLTSHEGRLEIATPGGVVYEVEVPLTVAERLPGLGEEVELRTIQVVREDTAALFGVLEAGERVLFQRLLTASGVGARLAVAMLSTYSAPRLIRALQERDLGALIQVPGVGRKKAERLVLELSDRVKDLDADGDPEGEASRGASAAVQALVALGMPFAEADRAVQTVVAEGASGTDEIVRKALAQR